MLLGSSSWINNLGDEYPSFAARGSEDSTTATAMEVIGVSSEKSRK
jgi:hypothetical protein